MAKTKLTSLKVENAKPDPSKRLEIADAGKPGLYLVVQSNGRKSWAVRYRRVSDRKPRKYTLPGFPSLAMAHKLAQEALDKVANGHDPAAEKLAAKRAPAPASVEDALHQFIVGHTRTKKGRAIRETTRRENARLLGFEPNKDKPGEWVVTGKGVLARWEGRALADIGREQVRQLGRDLVKAGPVTANRTLAVLKTCFTWFVRQELLAKSPCEGVDPPAAEERQRQRVLIDAELAALWRAADATGYPFGRFVQLLILTGCRRDEVREAQWAEVDMAKREWLIPGRRTKNGREHVVPITDTMASILDSMPRISGGKLLFTTTGDTPIAGMSKGKNRLHDAMTKALGKLPKPLPEPERWTLHDLRRTFVTGLQRLRFPLEVAEACVNHASGSTSGVTGVYARHKYTVEKLEALDAWASHVVGIVGNRPADNVVQLVRA